MHWNVTDGTHCELCPLRTYEDLIHLFFECSFSRGAWNYRQIDWEQHDDLQVVIFGARQCFVKPFFNEVIITTCWNILLIQNGQIFR
jgi:hypothetical protein